MNLKVLFSAFILVMSVMIISKIMIDFRLQMPRGNSVKVKLKINLITLNRKNIFYPKYFNWMEHGAVTGIKNREFCRSDWAFSATGSLEGQWFLRTGKLISLSEQNLIDCSYDYGNNGCSGGHVSYAFEYIKHNKGIESDSNYPYDGEEYFNCRYNKSGKSAKILDWTVVYPKGNEMKLQMLLMNIGPLSVGINLQKSFYAYTNGVYYETNCTKFIDYLVLLVGYGKDIETKEEYWLIKNSMGMEWGENGYMRLARNKNNHCGIANYAVYPMV